MDQLIACLAIKEAFAVLLANYVSFEKAVAAANIEGMVERRDTMTDLHNRRREVDRHLVNLLAAGEMFSEHALRRTKKEFRRKPGKHDALDRAFHEQRKRLVGFCVTEGLRDAVLHNALPITSWTMGGKWVGLEPHDGGFSELSSNARLEHSVTFSFATDQLAQDKRFDPTVIDRLKAERADANGRVSWVLIIREYVEGLSMILGEIRSIWAEVEKAASVSMIELVETYRASLPEGREQPLHVFVAELDGDGRWLREVLLTADLEGRLTELRRQHHPMLNLHRRSLAG